MSFCCPTCRKTVNIKDGKALNKSFFFPFCSERCKLIDLGEWLDAGYVIKTPLNADQEEEKSGGNLIT